MEDVRAVDAGEVILQEIADLEVVRARAEAAIAERMVAFSDLRAREAARHDDRVVRRLEASFAADELAVVLRQPTRVVQNRVAEARRIRRQLPTVWSAWRAGDLDGFRSHVVDEHAARLVDPASIEALDVKVAEYAATHTVAQTRAWMRRFIARTEPAHHHERHRRAFADRRVVIDHDADGVAWVQALVSATDAAQIGRVLDTIARTAPADDSRTIDQRQADAFANLLLGRDAAGSAGSVRGGAVIGVVVPVTTLTGLDDTPGTSFDGQIALPASLVRDLAAEPGTLFYRIFTDPLGGVLDITELGRFPSKRLRTAVEIVHGTCLFPTCSRPAQACDLDHQVPHPRGPTAADNLAPLCRRHHRMKTVGVMSPPTYRRRRPRTLDTGVPPRATPPPVVDIHYPRITIERDIDDAA